MIRSVLEAWCDHCGSSFGPKRFDGKIMTYWVDENELFFALGRAGWGLLFGDDGERTAVMCAECRQGGDE